MAPPNTESPTNSTINNNPDSATQAEIIYKLTFLCSLIAKPFDGNRTELHEFISNCNNAFRFANPQQTDALIAFVISKITGSAKAQLRDKCITSWEQLKSLLLRLYSDKKHYTQLMEELNTIKQHNTESVLSFYNRIDKLCTRILNSVSCRDEGERLGRVETIKELSLQRFILHSLPDISRFLRGKEPKNLSDAFNAAAEEERALQVSKSNYLHNHNKNKYCSNCKTKSHNTRDCFKKNNNRSREMTVNLNAPQNVSRQNFQRSNKFCNYCKKQGHLIADCFKRKKNNETYNNNSNSNFSQNSNQNANVHLNETISGNNVVSTEWE